MMSEKKPPSSRPSRWQLTVLMTLLLLSNAAGQGPSNSPSAGPARSASAGPSASSDGSLTTGVRVETDSPTPIPSVSPSKEPTSAPTPIPTVSPSKEPTSAPTSIPTVSPSKEPTSAPTPIPTVSPSKEPSTAPTPIPTVSPSEFPTARPSEAPTVTASEIPTSNPTSIPTSMPSKVPTRIPSDLPSRSPSANPTKTPSATPTVTSSGVPTVSPSTWPSRLPSFEPSMLFSVEPSLQPSPKPSFRPSFIPSAMPSPQPSVEPSVVPSLSSAPSITDATNSPTVSPSKGPSYQPSIEPSSVPSRTPTVSSAPTTATPSSAPSVGPSISPSDSSASPTTRGTVFEQVRGLQMELLGLSDLPEDSYGDYQDTMSAFVEIYAASVDLGVEGLQSTVRVTGTSSSGSRQLRRLQTSVTVTYEQDFEYLPLTAGVTAPFLATAPFSQEIGRNEFVFELQSTDALVFGALEAISEVVLPDTEAPSAAPTEASAAPTELTEAPTISPTGVPKGDDGGLSTGAIIGIAVAGFIVFLVVIYFSMCRSRDENESAVGNPPLVVKAPVGGDEVSTLGGAIGGGPPTSGSVIYGDQSVATVDYDYSKAYGGGGDTSVSSAGGTFGSNRQGGFSTLDTKKASAIGAVADYPDDNSAEPRYRDPKAGVKEEYIEIIAPAGKLGVVIDTPNDGPPVVHAVKDSSPIENEIRVGDKLVAVDDEDVRRWSAIEVSKLISRKSAKSYRKLGIIRSTFVG